jgi:hypothetical protein
LFESAFLLFCASVELSHVSQRAATFRGRRAVRLAAMRRKALQSGQCTVDPAVIRDAPGGANRASGKRISFRFARDLASNFKTFG